MRINTYINNIESIIRNVGITAFRDYIGAEKYLFVFRFVNGFIPFARNRITIKMRRSAHCVDQKQYSIRFQCFLNPFPSAIHLFHLVACASTVKETSYDVTEWMEK